jgi:hypothetical protein
MAEGAAHTIILREWSLKRYKAKLATGSDITPGMLCELPTVDTIRPHSSAAGIPAPLIVATEATEVGRGIEDAYAVDGEEVNYAIVQQGEWFYGLLAAGEDIAANDLLESAGDGTLQADTSGDKFRALEAVDNSAGYEAVRIKVEVL